MSKPFESATQRRRYGSSGWDWQRRRDAVIARDGGLCQLRLEGCTTKATTADHIVSPRRGGTDHPMNLRAACQHCNELAGGIAPRRSVKRTPERHPGLI